MAHKFSRVHRPETQKCGRAARSTFSECGNSIPFLEVERLVKICLEDELRQSKNECSKLKQQVSVLLGHEIKVKEVEDRLARVLLRVRCQVDGGMGSSGGENQGGDLMTEGSIEATASVAGEKKVDEASKLDVKKENGGASGLGMDQLGAGSQGTTTPKSAKVIIDIPDSDDEFTPPKAAPKEVSARPHLEPGLSGEDETHVLKRKMTDTGTNDNNSSRDKKKITRVADSIPGNDGETTSAQQKLDSPPSSIQDKETMDAEQFADELFTWDMASMFDVDPSSSPSSSSDFDCIDLDLVMHILEGLNGKD